MSRVAFPGRITAALILFCCPLLGEQRVTVRVDAAVGQGPFRPVWTFLGYDEANFTYSENGKKLLHEFRGASRYPSYARTHNLLTTGDGTPALKWGSTNAYTEDASGRPVYDWTIVDRIFDTYRAAGITPFVEVGFMPEAMSIKPEPYRHHWPQGGIAAGWAYPPKSYEKWAELVHQWVLHSVQRYGAQEVRSWYWEVWNEPNIEYWQGSPEEYDKLYDFTADAVKRALPGARIGGPASTGPGSPKAAAFLKQFLEHCSTGRNYVSGRTGSPLDFISFHAKGRPQVVDGHVEMGLSSELQDAAKGFETISGFSAFKSLPIILSESDPEGCAACSARDHPQNAYRNGPLYPCYTAEALERILALAQEYKVNLEGVLTWAFDFENEPYFAGLRTLATHGIDKPVLNLFRMLGLMGGERVKAESTGALSLDSVLNGGVRGQADTNAVAARGDREVSVLVWNYEDRDITAPPASLELDVQGIPDATHRVLVHHYRIDDKTSNASSAWIAMGSPQQPSQEQYAELEAAGQLHLLTSPYWVTAQSGKVKLDFVLPHEGLSLVTFRW